jgi:hypothetical protein
VCVCGGGGVSLTSPSYTVVSQAFWRPTDERSSFLTAVRYLNGCMETRPMSVHRRRETRAGRKSLAAISRIVSRTKPVANEAHGLLSNNVETCFLDCINTIH